MTYERIKRPSSGKPESQDAPSRFAPRPFTIQPQQDVEKTPTQEGKGQNAKIPESDILPQGVLSRHAIRPKLPGIQMKKLDFKWPEEQVQQSEPADIQHKDVPQQKVETPKKPETQPTPSPEQKTVPGDTKAPEATKEPEFRSGLATESLTNAFGKEASDFWKDPGNQEKPITDLVDFLMAKVNEKLPYKCKHEYTTSGPVGIFDANKWFIYINKAEFSQDESVATVGEFTHLSIMPIVNTIYHEARHAEQFFRMAQMRAGQGKTAEDIEAEMSIPLAVAEAAMKSPLIGNTETNKKMLAETQTWDSFKYGKYVGEYSSELSEIMLLRFEIENVTDTEPTISKEVAKIKLINSKIAKHLNKLEKIKVEIEKNNDINSFEQTIIKHIKELSSASNKLKIEIDQQKAYQSPNDPDYRNFRDIIDTLRQVIQGAYDDDAVEKDAGEVGNAAGLAFLKQSKGKR